MSVHSNTHIYIYQYIFQERRIEEVQKKKVNRQETKIEVDA